MFFICLYCSIGMFFSVLGVVVVILCVCVVEWEVVLIEMFDSLIMYVWGSELMLIFDVGSIWIELNVLEQCLIGVLQDSVIEFFESYGLNICWDWVNVGVLIFGFVLMQVECVMFCMLGFLCVCLCGDEVVCFGQGSLYFCLLIVLQGCIL